MCRRLSEWEDVGSDSRMSQAVLRGGRIKREMRGIDYRAGCSDRPRPVRVGV